MTPRTRGLVLCAMLAPAAALAQDQGTTGTEAMTCADFVSLDSQTQGTVLLQGQAGTPGAAPDSAPGGSAETAIGGGAGLDGSPGTQSGATPDASGGGTTSGTSAETPPTNEGIQGTGTEAASGAGEGTAMPATLDAVVAHCRDNPTATVAEAVRAGGSPTGGGATAN